MDLTSKLIDTTKKGTIIFSHYRSGGTQLKLIVRNVLNDIYKINSDHLKSLVIVDACIKSSKTGKKIQIQADNY